MEHGPAFAEKIHSRAKFRGKDSFACQNDRSIDKPEESTRRISMITQEEYGSAVDRSIQMLQQAGFAITPAERERLEVADFGLGELSKVGLEILTYVNTDRVCAKEIIMFPHQTCPEHWHPTIDGKPGKEETFRCRWGTVYLYVPGAPAANPS